MVAWFERRNGKKAPDESTIARKIRVVWQEMHRP
jgi:phage gp16-like protein